MVDVDPEVATAAQTTKRTFKKFSFRGVDLDALLENLLKLYSFNSWNFILSSNDNSREKTKAGSQRLSSRLQQKMHQLRRLLLQPSSPLRVLSAKKSLASLKRCSHFSSSSESQISNSHLIEHLEENPNEPATGTTISVDRSGLYNPTGTHIALTRICVFTYMRECI